MTPDKAPKRTVSNANETILIVRLKPQPTVTIRRISVNNVSSSDTDDEDKRLTVDLTQCVHVAIAEAFGCEKWQIVQRVMFGDIDVLEGETFEDHGIEVAFAENTCARLPVPGRLRVHLLSDSAMPVWLCVWPPGRGEVQREHQDAEGEFR